MLSVFWIGQVYVVAKNGIMLLIPCLDSAEKEWRMNLKYYLEGLTTTLLLLTTMAAHLPVHFISEKNMPLSAR